MENFEIWFVTGSQHLYGAEALAEVNQNLQTIVKHLNNVGILPIPIVPTSVLTTREEIDNLFKEIDGNRKVCGIITWMHTFSPAKMWIQAIKNLRKPLLHLHTQFFEGLPWDSIDMNYMNLHQSAHGDREFGFLCTRIGKARKVITGYWKDPDVLSQIASWSRCAIGWASSQELKIARFGDNMRQVAVTEGNKVSAEETFGYQVWGFGIGELVRSIREISDLEVHVLTQEYSDLYELEPELQEGGTRRQSLNEAARIELGLRSFLKSGNFGAFTDTFEDLQGLHQLPGIAVQRLMADGYGFGAEGDWKTAALVRTMKIMAHGLPGGNSFMEDYTYHLAGPEKLVLGAHMLEICPSISREKPRCEIHALSIGGKADPVRLVFNGAAGVAINVCLIDLGHRFRLIINKVQAMESPHSLPNLPVARVLWQPLPDLPIAASGWILAGGAHHTCFSQNLSSEQMEDWAEMMGIECITIDEQTSLRQLKQELRNNEYHFANHQL